MRSRRITLLGWVIFFIFTLGCVWPSRPELTRHAELLAGERTKPRFDIILMVPSTVGSTDRGASLRIQFARNQNLTSAKALLVFVLSGHNRIQPAIGQEASLYNDLIFTDCQDLDIEEPEERSSTTCKVLQGIQELHKLYSFDFLARVGDDAYFRFDKFLDQVVPLLLPVGPWYVGRFFWDNSVDRAHIQAHLQMRHYSPYASGMGYVLSSQVVRYIAEASRILEFRTGFPEDAIVALWILGTTTRRHDVPEFHNPPSLTYIARRCDNESLLVHYMTPEWWKAIDDAGVRVCLTVVVTFRHNVRASISILVIEKSSNKTRRFQLHALHMTHAFICASITNDAKIYGPQKCLDD
jgi:hypothetical protein